MTLSATGTFDNFNRFALRGVPRRAQNLYDTLFVTSDDEPGSYYPLIAENVRYADNFARAEISLNPRARFHDGSPVRASDVAFTFHKFMTEGAPQFRIVYKGASVRAIAPLTVRIELSEPNKENMLSLFSLPVMPESFWKAHKLSDPLSTPPLAGGPYRITDWRMGQYVVYSRVKDYWAANLPVNRGAGISTPFAMITTDDNVAFEAFKAGAFDLRPESSAKTGLRAISVKLRQRLHRQGRAQNSSAQTRAGWRLIFSARCLTTAGTSGHYPAFDFEWMNKALFYGAYSRANSYFQNTEYAARAYPNADELTLLAPSKHNCRRKCLPPCLLPHLRWQRL